MENEALTLLSKNETELTTEQLSFVELHKEIIDCGVMAADYLVRYCGKLKEMRDRKLYKQAGYEEFEEYTQDALSINKRQAYTYISVYEKYGKDFLQSNAKIGVTKLALLASIPTEDRNEILSENNVTDTSVAELKAIIAEKDKKIEQMTLVVKSNDELIDAKDAEMDKNVTAARKAITEAKEAKEKAEAEVKKAKESADALKAEKDKLEKELAVAKNLKPEVKTETVENPETAIKLEATAKALSEKEEEIAMLEKKLTITSDSTLAQFKVLFATWQNVSSELVRLLFQLNDEKCDKCKKAINAVIAGWEL